LFFFFRRFQVSPEHYSKKRIQKNQRQNIDVIDQATVEEQNSGSEPISITTKQLTIDELRAKRLAKFDRVGRN
jgi:hypothetical protein